MLKIKGKGTRSLACFITKGFKLSPPGSFLPFVPFIWCHEEFLNKSQIKQSASKKNLAKKTNENFQVPAQKKYLSIEIFLICLPVKNWGVFWMAEHTIVEVQWKGGFCCKRFFFRYLHHFYVLCRLFVAKSVFQLRKNPARDDDCETHWKRRSIQKAKAHESSRSLRNWALIISDFLYDF